MNTRHPLLCIALLVCVSCGQAPQIGVPPGPAEQNAPFPDLLPITTLLAGQPGQPRLSEASTQTLSARIAQLRRRAALLQGPVIDPATRATLRAGVARAALR